MEKVKRLDPKISTLKELFVKSGNKCAFPTCSISIVNEEGTLFGEVFHIEGALPNSERFNPTQTNEERREISNLIYCVVIIIKN
ncbi:hypothetical protein [Thalassobacillus sp. C254]|uniref:hypothetical protein n=1 Tax=Thalassobacillus sp. C254 TaxID=1225341 RepID=UPI0006CFCFA8|nr:hypothetical protein [Thalassobacillus sp. C254]